jgi:beta-aspartyl-peptidase (threonine type)
MALCLALHGGAGQLSRVRSGRTAAGPKGATSAAQKAALESAEAMRLDLERALAAGFSLLESGASALDAVVAAVVVLEDSVHFNAGRGSVLRSDGSVRMDASVMYGPTRTAGAVAGVTIAQNPIRAAQRVLADGRHVLRAAEHADRFVREQKLATQPPEYFITPYRRAQWERARAKNSVELDHTDDERGTVGAVALDAQGHLAAATSTGGLTNADPGRVGDSPIIGAGTWAHDETCAVSATGTGEFFIRAAFAHSVHGHWLHTGGDLAASTALALREVQDLGGHGGCIAIDRNGRVALPFTTPDMPRAYRCSGEAPIVIVFDP